MMEHFHAAQIGLDDELHPHQKIAAVEAYCQGLETALMNFESLDMSLLQSKKRGGKGTTYTSPRRRTSGSVSPRRRAGGGGCFPADSTVLVQTAAGVKEVVLRDVQSGDMVAVGEAANLAVFYAAMLTDLHSPKEHDQEGIEYIHVVHATGSLNITGSHFVATVDRGFVPASTLARGDELLVQRGEHLRPSTVLAFDRVFKQGAFAPLTWGGTVLVDGVLVSSYALPPPHVLDNATLGRFAAFLGGWSGLNQFMHAWMLPIRLAHNFGFPGALHRLGGFGWVQRALSADDQNADGSATGWAVPRYVDSAVSHLSSLIKLVF